eukprot:gene24665-29802_t
MTDSVNLSREREKETKARMAQMRKDRDAARKSGIKDNLTRQGYDADAYATLGVSRNASESEVRSAYKRLSLKYHPDKNPGGHDKFLAIKKAHDSLLDKKARSMVNRLQPRQKKTKQQPPTDHFVIH